MVVVADKPETAGGAAVERLPMPSHHNPLPLSASQETQVRDVFYARVRSKCADDIKAFAECALGRTFTAPFVCRAQHRVMNACMKLHATPAEHDAAREEWFATRMERQREREQKHRRKLEQEKFLREWWGLPEKDEAQRRKEEEKMSKGERFGGFAAKDRVRLDGEERSTGEKR